MVSTTWQYRQSDTAIAQREAEREISDLRDALYELPGVARQLAADVGLSFTSRTYTFFVRTGVAGTAADPLLVGFVSATSTANVVASSYTIDAPGRTGWELTQAGALQYVGAALPDDTAAFTLDITATLGADLEAHARINVIAQNLSPFRLRNAPASDITQFPTLTDTSVPIRPTVAARYTETYSSSAPTSTNNALGVPLVYETGSPGLATYKTWQGSARDFYLPLGEAFISADVNALYTYDAECSVPSAMDIAVVSNPDAPHISRSRPSTNVRVQMLEQLMLQPRMTGNASVSVFARNQDNQIAGGFTFHYDGTTSTAGGDDYQNRSALLRRFPKLIRMPRSETASIPLGDYFTMGRYGVPPLSLLWTVTIWGVFYEGTTGHEAIETRLWWRAGYPATYSGDTAVLSDTANISVQSDRFRYRIDETGVLYLETTATSGTGGATGSYVIGIAVSPNVVGESARYSPFQSLTVEIIDGLGFTQDRYEFVLPAGQSGTPTAYELGTIAAWGTNVTYALTAGDATKFAVDSSTGVVTYIGSGESADSRDPEFRLEVTAQQGTDITDTDTAEVIVTVEGVLEAPIRFGSDRYEFFVPENTAGPYRESWSVVASSVITGETPIITYTSSDASVISVAANGDITYEGDALTAGDTVTVTITASTGAGTLRQIATTIVEIGATATSRAAPTITFNNTPYVFSLAEDTSGVTADPLGTISASVSGAVGTPEQLPQIRYGIETEGVPFSIDPVSGVLRYTGEGEVYDNRRVWLFQAVATTAATLTALAGRQVVFVRVNITRNTELPDDPVFSQDAYSFTAPSGTAGTTIPIPIGYTPASGADVGYQIYPPATETAGDWAISADALITYTGAAKTAGTVVVLTAVAETNSSNADISQRGEDEATVTVTFTAGTQALQTITWPAANLTNGRYEFSVEENTATPHTLATILPTVAAPAGSTAGALTLTRGGPDSDRFTWSDTGLLQVTGTLDFDSKQVYTLLLTATAAATTTARETVSSRWVKLTLTEDATDVVSAPIFSADDYAFDLTADVDGSVTAIRLGQISAAAREGALTYALTAGDATKFAVDMTTGEVTYIGTGETAGSEFAITVTATATLGAQSASASVVARITTIATAQAPVTITSADAPAAVFVIPSDTDGRTTAVYVGTIPFTASSTAGVSAIGAWSYEIEDGNLTATARGNTALIYYVGPPMAAGSNAINTTITATTASTARTEAGTYTLRLIATFADEMPLFGRAAYEFNLSSEADGSTTPVEIGTVTATPVESYEIVLGDTNLFAVNASTGVITYLGTSAALTATDTRTIQIQATNATETATANVLITVKSPVTVSFVPAAPAWTLAENTAGPVTLGTLTVRTVSADINGLPSAPSLVAGGTDARFIGIAATAHNTFTITYTGAARATPLNFTLTATCAENGTALEADAVLTVGVPIVPATPLLDAASYSYVLPDGTDPPPVYLLGTPAITNSAGYTQRWRIITAQTGQRLFAIDAATGALTYDGPAAADRDTTPSYTLQIGVVNQRDALSSAEATATVTIGVPVAYSAPVRNASWSPGAGWTLSADGSWHRTMTASQVVAIDITAGATGPYTIQQGLTANYRNTTVPSPATDFSVVRSDGVFTVTASATQTGSETLYLYLSDGTTEERLDFHIQVVSSATTTATDVVWYQDEGAGYSAIGSRGVTINFAEGAAGQVATNIYAAYTNIQNRTNASLDEPTLNGFDIIVQTSPRRQIRVGSEMIWIDAYTINVEPSQFDFETQSSYDLTATLNVPEYTAGSTTWAAAHKPLSIRLLVSDVDEPPARTAVAAPADFGLRKQGAVVQFSLSSFWRDPEGRTLSYRLTQTVVGATGGQSTTPSDYLAASIIGSDFQASAGQTALETPTGVTILFSVEAYDGTQYSAPMTFSCDEVHGRALEDSPLAWSSGLPQRLVWQVAENIAVPYVLRNDIFASSTVTDLTATAGALTYSLEEATYYPVRNTDYTFADNAPSLAAGATLDIDLTNAFQIEGSEADGKDFTITATSSNTAALTITVTGKTATLTAANNLAAESTSTFTLIAHAGGFVAQYVGIATIASAISVTANTGYTDTAISLASGAAQDVDVSTAFTVTPSGTEWVLTAVSDDTDVATVTVNDATKTLTITGSALLTAADTATITYTATIGTLTVSRTITTNVAMAAPTITAKTTYTAPANVTGAGTATDQFVETGGATFAAANLFDSTSTAQIYQLVIEAGTLSNGVYTTLVPAHTLTAGATGNSGTYSPAGGNNPLRISNWQFRITAPSGFTYRIRVRARLANSHTTTAETTIYVK